MVYPRFAKPETKPAPVQAVGFRGYGLESDPASLPPGYLAAGSMDIDLSRAVGALAKRRGIEAQAPAVAGSGVNGLGTWHTATGDRLLFAQDGVLYELTGSAAVLTKSTTENFAAGEHTHTEAADDQLRLMAGETSGIWVSPIYDLGTTPETLTMDWTDTHQAGTEAVTAWVRVSEDGQAFGPDVSADPTGSDALPLGRFVQVRFDLSTTVPPGQPAVQAFTLNFVRPYAVVTERAADLTGSELSAQNYRGQWLFCDSARPRRWTGTAFYPLGVDVPGTAPILAAGDAGLPDGEYRGRVTFVNNHGAESNGGPVSDALTAANQMINWSGIPLGPAGTTARKLYRTRAGGAGAYYHAATMPNNTATAFVGDNLADEELTLPLTTDNDLPPESLLIYAHKDYLLYVPKAATMQNRVYFSKRVLPDSVPALAYKTFPDRIRALRTYQDALVVGGERFTAAVLGEVWDSDPGIDNTTIRLISEDTGPVSRQVMQTVATPTGEILVFPTRDQVVYLRPGLQAGSLTRIPLSDRVAPLLRQARYRYRMAAISQGHRYLLALADSTAPTVANNLILVYDTRTGEWSPPWRIAAMGFTLARGRVYIGSPAAGQVFELDKGTDDAGANINAVAVLRPEYTRLGAQARKRFGPLRLVVTPDSRTDTLEIQPAVDGVSTTLRPGAVSTWGGGLVSPRLRLGLPPGHRYEVRVEDDSKFDWVVTAVITEYERGE